MDLTLFGDDPGRKRGSEEMTPLAWRLRPETLAEFVGQEKVLGKGSVLRKAIEEDNLSSVIFWGPPGAGKTTLAKIISNTTRAYFTELSAVTSNVSELRKVLQQAEQRTRLHNQKTILLIDELHRFNKAQQDALLPAVEEGIVVLIGVTTENPYFEVISPLISRCRIFIFEPLSSGNVRAILERALNDSAKGLGKYNVCLGPQALNHIVKISQGDARQALNILEMAALATRPDQDKRRIIALKTIEDAAQKRALRYDRAGDAHYDSISAFIKSIRGSDPDAALYWLGRMIYVGEDPKFIARRMIIAASEDIGLADSQALEVAVAAARAVEFVGMPEARINLAHAAIYLSTAPKSNSVIKSIDAVLAAIKNERSDDVPKHLRDASYPGAKEIGHGAGYKYPHAYKTGYVEQEYLPDNVKAATFYVPSSFGDEKRIKEYLNKLKRHKESK